MQSDHDPTRVYAKLRELYQEAHAVHVASGDALVEIINTLSRKAEADAAFLRAFAHLVPRPIAPTHDTPMPPHGDPPQVGDPFGPPPLPEQNDIPPEDVAWARKMDAYRQQFPRG